MVIWCRAFAVGFVKAALRSG
ncbi:MAG: hypothetical protein ACR2JO_04565 [Mycobacteriales bacterium]